MLRKITPFVLLAALSVLPGSGGGGYARAEDYTCDTTEQQIVDLINEDNGSRLVAKLEGERIATFAAYLTGHGYLQGTLSGVDSIYIVTGKMKPGYEEHPSYWLFFIKDHCLISKMGADKAIIDEAIK